MKINNFRQSLEIFATALIMLFAILLSIGGIISISQAFSEDKTEDKEKFKIIGLIPDTRWVQFTNEIGGELYICITPVGEIYEIQKDSEGWVSSKTSVQRDAFSYLYEPSSVFENECWKDINKLPEKVQIEMIRIIYRKDLSL